MNKVYEYVTERILEQLEKGIVPWHKPWSNGLAINYITRKPYRGVNLILLDRSGEYLTFKQVQALGGSIKKGAKSHMVVYYKIATKNVPGSEELESETIKRYFLLRYYKVFHLSDVEGIESKLEVIHNDPIQAAETIVEGYKDSPKIIHENNSRAFYNPSLDYINTPEINVFPQVEEYYSTLFHEMVHSTGHKNRLQREGIKDSVAAFGSETYSKEELVAELGSAMLCGTAGIENMTVNNSAAYIQSWLKALKNDKSLVVKAATLAQKASDYILGKLQDRTEEGEE